MNRKKLTKTDKARKPKVIFLDRDGVINRYPGRRQYVNSLASFKFIKGSLKAIRKLTQAGYVIFVISNQAGVAKKLYTKATLKKITQKMLRGVEKANGKITRVYYCTHLPLANCACRKPKNAFIKKAIASFNSRVDRKSSYLVGDDLAKDIAMGKRSRLITILVLGGRNRSTDVIKPYQKPDYVFKNLLEATNFILRK